VREVRAKPDAVIAELAARQYGVVTIAQLEGAGFDKSAVTRRVQSGQLHRVFRGVYAVGHAGLGNEGRWSAALLACGEGSVLSHRSAAEHLGMLQPSAGPVHVTVPGRGGRMHRPNLRIHRSSLLQSSFVIRDGLAVTTPARTLRDLPRVADQATVRKAIRQAEIRGYELGELKGDGTLSELEHLFLRLCRRHRLPRPEVNARIGRYRPDFLWRQERLIAETDGWRYHRGRQAAEDDQRRQRALERLGFRVLRFTYRQVTQEPTQVASAIRKALLASSSR
jgi:very-short-patch-repair endonuclease